MKRSTLPCRSQFKKNCVKEHDYSTRWPENKMVSVRTTFPAGQPGMSDISTRCKYEVTELCIEPIVVNVVKVLAANGVATQMSTNIPLEEICHTDDPLEIIPIDDLPFDEDASKIICLNDVCKVCLKDLIDSPDKIPFFDDFGQISAEMANIIVALESMNVEVTSDNNSPNQICIECFHIFSKMALFRQVCERSRRALADISEFVNQQQLTINPDDDTSVLGEAICDIIEIKEEKPDTPEPAPISEQFAERDDSATSTIRADDSSDHRVVNLYICNRCGRDFDHRNSLFYHKRFELCVDEVNPECRVCKEIYPTIIDLDQHLENSHNCFSCTKCAKSFNTPQKLNKHRRYHASFICDFCGKSFHSKSSIREHLKSHVVGLHPCLFCRESFKTVKRLGMHKRKIHPLEMYKCPHCPKEFKLKDRYRVHLMKHDPDKRYKCTFCPSQFVHRHHLNNHIRTHTKETPFLCNFCGKAFRGEVALRDHLSIHDSVTYPYRNRKRIENCTLCDYSSSHGNLRAHMTQVHGQGVRRRVVSKKPEYSCSICEKEFRQSSSLANHLKTHNEVRNHHCPHCKQSFRKATYLKLHIDGVHLNKKPNKCDQCDAAYLMSNDLRRHKMQRHSTERPFECYYCNKRFALTSALKAHIKLLHRVKTGDSKK